MKKKFTGIFVGTKVTVVKDGKVQSTGTVAKVKKDWTGSYLELDNQKQIRIAK